MAWLDGFDPVTFKHSPGFAPRPAGRPIRGVGWHTTEGWTADAAFGVYARFPSCPSATVAYRETGGGRDLTRYVTKRRFQHVDTDLAAYAFEHGDASHYCRVETNAGGIVQIERVGFASDDVELEELRWLGEEVLAPILRAHPHIPNSVYKGGRMTEAELESWAGGHLGHRDMPCQPAGHSDPGGLDLDAILHFALELINPPAHPLEHPDMILLRVVDDPAYPVEVGGVILELSGNGISWVRSGNVARWYPAGGVRTVDVTVAEINEALWTKAGVGPPPSTAVPPSAVHWN